MMEIIQVKTIGMVILVLIVILLVLAIGGGLFFLLAYGVGAVITRVTGLETLPATVISMASMFLFGILLERAFNSFVSLPKNLAGNEEFNEDEYDFEDEQDDYFDFEEDSDLSAKEMDAIFAGVPRWRRPLKTVDFSNVKPDDRCPCGSGRKFKNCHGKKTKETKA
jgi:SEC-C motif